MSAPALRTVFLGTSHFALPILRALNLSNHDITAVVTRPPREAGRGRKLTQPPVAELAGELGLNVLQPGKLTGEFIETLAALHPDVMVSADYGAWLPEALLNSSPLGVVNVHPSLLPKHRGAAPVPRAILSGETGTGVTFMLTDNGWDTGPVIAQFHEPIHPNDTSGTLEERLAMLSGEHLPDVLTDYASGLLVPVPQEGDSDYAEKLSTEETWLDWELKAEKLDRIVRAFNPAPGARTTYKGKLLKLFRTEVAMGDLDPGHIRVAGDHITVGCAMDTALEVWELQPEGKRSMTVEDFLRGTQMRSGERLGD